MLVHSLCEYYENNVVLNNSLYLVAYKVHKSRKTILGNKRIFNIDALLVLKTNEINFTGIVGIVHNDIIKRHNYENIGILCNWLVCSERGGIYLYEAISTKENQLIGNIKNSYMILNIIDGTMSFGPGHIKNQEYSRIFNYLIENERSMNQVSWRNELYKLLNYSFDIIRKK